MSDSASTRVPLWRDHRPEVALPGEPVTLGADAVPRLPPQGELGRSGLVLAGQKPQAALVHRRRDDLHRRRHDGVEDSAELGAAPLEDAFARRLEPEHVRPPRDGVALSGELGHPPAVVDVVGDELELHRPVDREHEPVDGDLAVGVDVLPVELMALYLDDELVCAVAARRLDGRRAGEDDDCDADQDDRGNGRPDDLEPRVSVDLRALGSLGLRVPAAEADDEEDERGLHGDEDDRTDGEDEPVELVDRLPARGSRIGGAEAAIARILSQCDRCRPEREHRERGGDDGGRAPPHGPVRFYSARREPVFATNVTRSGELQFTRNVVQ